MSAEFDPGEESDLLAAEHALRLLTGEELLAARRRLAGEPEFAAAVAGWEDRLAPLLDGVAEVAPPPELWRRIEREIPTGAEAGGNVVELRRAVRRWRGFAGAAGAIAAALLLFASFTLVQPERRSEVAAPAPDREMAVASLTAENGSAAVAVAFQPASGTLVVTPTRVLAAAGRSFELWLLPPSGNPISLGLVRAGEPRRLALPAEVPARTMLQAQVAISLEPAGGSPTGLPTGPVLATAPFSRI